MSIEHTIRDLINHHDLSSQMFDEIAAYWDSSKTSDTDLEELAEFLFNSGQMKILTKLMALQVLKRPFNSWELLARLVKEADLNLTDKEKEAFREGLKNDWAKADICLTTSLDEQIPEIKEWRARQHEKIAIDTRSHRESLFEQLQFSKLQRLRPEEDRVLDELRLRFPSDPEVLLELKNRQEVEAHEILQRHEPLSDDELIDELTFTDDEKTWLEELLRQWLCQIKQKPVLELDAAIFFMQMEAYPQAVSILQAAQPGEKRDWLLLEALVLAKQFILALSMCDENESVYGDHPDTMFSTLFARAKCYWGLGHKEMAIEILRSILNIRPQFRAASILLQDWTGRST